MSLLKKVVIIYLLTFLIAIISIINEIIVA